MLRRGTCASVEGKGPVQECRTRPRPQGTPAALDLFKGTCDPQGLSVFAAHRTLRGKCRGPEQSCFLVTRRDLSMFAVHRNIAQRGPAQV